MTPEPSDTASKILQFRGQARDATDSLSSRDLRTGGGGGTSGGMVEQRLSRLETDMSEVKSILGRLASKVDEMYGFLQATLPTLATKADLAGIQGVTPTLAAKADLAGIQATLPTLATKADLAGIQAVTPTLATKADLAEKPSRGHLWAALGVTWAIALGVAALMVDLLR